MHRTSQVFLRGRSFYSVFSKKPQDGVQLTPEQQEAMKKAIVDLRTDAPRAVKSVADEDFETDDIINRTINMDAIRARGRMKYVSAYNPPSTVKVIVEEEAKKAIQDSKTDNILNYTFASNNDVKAELISNIGERLSVFPTNSVLAKLKTVQDVLDFYNTPIENINAYSKLARASNKPSNVHILEQPVRFNPNDTEAWHGGVTAFPGTGGEVISLRNKRLLRQFQPKEDWFDYEDQTFDYCRPEKDMPWDSEIAKKMDRYPDKRYNLSTKTFKRM